MLYKSFVFFVALRYAFCQPINQFSKCLVWFSRLSIMLGITILIITLSVMNGFEYELKKNFFNFIPHIILTTNIGYVCDISNKPKTILNTLQNDIIRIEPIVISDIILQSTQSISHAVMLGVYSNSFEPLSKYLIYSNFNRLTPESYFIIIGSTLAKRLKIQINDKVRLIIPSILQKNFFGHIPRQRLFTVLDIYHTNSEADSCQVLLNHIDASRIMCYPNKWCFTGWRIWLRNPFVLNNFDKLQLSNDWIWKDRRKHKSTIFQAINMEKKLICLLFSLITIAAGLNIISFLILSITEKKIEIAILRVCGCTRIQIMLIFMIQGIINGIIGICLGTGLGILISKKFDLISSFLNIFIQLPLLPIEIQYFQIFNVIMITFFLILISTLLPSLKAMSINPSEVLCHE